MIICVGCKYIYIYIFTFLLFGVVVRAAVFVFRRQVQKLYPEVGFDINGVSFVYFIGVSY